MKDFKLSDITDKKNLKYVWIVGGALIIVAWLSEILFYFGIIVLALALYLYYKNKNTPKEINENDFDFKIAKNGRSIR